MTISEIIFHNYALKEIPGEANNPEILQFFKKIGHSWVQSETTAWCAAFVNYVLKTAGYPNTGKLNAKSFLEIGDQISVPKPLGSSNEFVDIVLFWRGRKWTSWDPSFFETGHVGFFLKERGSLIYTLGGNQSNMVKVSAYDRSRLEQYRRIYKEM